MPGKRTLYYLSSGAFILASCFAQSHAAETRLAGFLFDRSCADNIQAQALLASELAKEHTKECALNTNCSKNGYAVFSKGKWFQLDSKGNDLARQLLQTSKTKRAHFVTVSGSLEKELLKVESMKELACGD